MNSTSVNTFTSFFKHNLTVKILSLVLAISVWGFTVISRESRCELILPVDIMNIPSGYVIGMQHQGKAYFTVSGPAIWLNAAKENNQSIKLSLQGATAPGKTIFSNLDRNLNLHEGVRVIRTSPATIEIELLEKTTNSLQGDQHK